MKHLGMLGWIVTLSFASSPPGFGQDSAALPAELAERVPVYSETPLIIVHPVARFTPPPEEPPAPAVEPPVFTALSSIEYAVPGEGRSIIVHRVAPPELVIPPPPPAPAVSEIDHSSPEFQARLALWRAMEAKRRMVGLSVTVYDHKVSHIRWTWRDPSVPAPSPNARLRVVPSNGQAVPTSPPPGVVEYECWSNIDWEVMRGVFAVEAGGIRYEMMPGIGCVGVDTARRFGRTFVMPEHPELPESPATFVVTKGDPDNADATAFLRAVHAAYPAQAEELWAAKAARDQYLRDHAEWLKAHPPQPRNSVIRLWRPTPAQAQQIREALP